MTSRTIETSGEEQTYECGRILAPLLMTGDVLLLSGDLGAGKTTLAKGIAAGLGVEEPVTSPTFNIMVEHQGALVLHHFDLYRLESSDDLEDIDYFGTLESGGVSVVEWGDRFEESLPEDGLVVRIRITGDDTRSIELDPLGGRGQDLAAAWAEGCSGHGEAKGD